MVAIADEQKTLRLPEARVRRLVRRLIGTRSLSIAFVTNAVIRKINRKYLGHDFATDVLSFPLGSSPSGAPREVFGELVISAEYAASEAKARGIPVDEELLRYVAHGVLHLLGYDDHDPKSKARMWKRQEREVRKVMGPRP